jgi:hypothetical protein
MSILSFSFFVLLLDFYVNSLIEILDTSSYGLWRLFPYMSMFIHIYERRLFFSPPSIARYFHYQIDLYI